MNDSTEIENPTVQRAPRRNGKPGMAGGFRMWTPEEDAQVLARYQVEGVKQLAVDLNRSKYAIFNRAQYLGVSAYTTWTQREKDILEALWGNASIATIASDLGRNEYAVYRVAGELGLPIGVPEGCEYLSHAAERCGFNRHAMRTILRLAGVPVSATLSNPRKRKQKVHHRNHYVETEAANAAVKAWLETDTPGGAAKRFGVNQIVVWAALVRAGYTKPKRLKYKQHWRLPSTDIDAAMAKREGRAA